MLCQIETLCKIICFIKRNGFIKFDRWIMLILLWNSWDLFCSLHTFDLFILCHFTYLEENTFMLHILMALYWNKSCYIWHVCAYYFDRIIIIIVDVRNDGKSCQSKYALECILKNILKVFYKKKQFQKA